MSKITIESIELDALTDARDRLETMEKSFIKVKSDSQKKDMQIEAADQHVVVLEQQLEAQGKTKAMADRAIVEQHAHIQQLQQLLKRYLV